MKDVTVSWISIIISTLGIATLGYLGGVYSQERFCDVIKAQIKIVKQDVQALECSELQIQGLCNRALRSYIDAVFSKQDTFTKEEWEMERPYIVREQKEINED